MQDYQSVYLNLYAEFRAQRDAEKESINDDVVFEIELIKQVEINVDYILMLVERYRDGEGRRRRQGDPRRDRAGRRLQPVAAQQEGPHRGVRRVAVDRPRTSTREWAAFIAAKRAEELDRIIADEGLDREATHAFVEAAFRDGAVQPTGTAITKILPPVSRFARGGGHSAKKQARARRSSATSSTGSSASLEVRSGAYDGTQPLPWFDTPCPPTSERPRSAMWSIHVASRRVLHGPHPR